MVSHVKRKSINQYFFWTQPSVFGTCIRLPYPSVTLCNPVRHDRRNMPLYCSDSGSLFRKMALSRLGRKCQPASYIETEMAALRNLWNFIAISPWGNEISAMGFETKKTWLRLQISKPIPNGPIYFSRAERHYL